MTIKYQVMWNDFIYGDKSESIIALSKDNAMEKFLASRDKDERIEKDSIVIFATNIDIYAKLNECYEYCGDAGCEILDFTKVVKLIVELLGETND